MCRATKKKGTKQISPSCDTRGILLKSSGRILWKQNSTLQKKSFKNEGEIKTSSDIQKLKVLPTDF